MEIVCGDVHANFYLLNILLNNKRGISTIYQCGDFGYWPRRHGQLEDITKPKNSKRRYFDFYKLKNGNTKIYFCDGNHEDFRELNKLENNEIFRNVFYMKRGSVLTLKDGRNMLFIGGALSIDRKYRIIGETYFPEETITQKDIYNLPDINIDIVISHTAPREFDVVDYHEEYDKDPCRDALSYVLDKYKPSLWYHGHMHVFKQGDYNGCKWTCLSKIEGDERWWIKLGD